MVFGGPLSDWLRAVRLRFILSSIIAVFLGLSIVYSETGQIDVIFAILIFAGVIFLHVSIDLLNDYWDYAKGIDQITKRTKFSGGTGVLPTGLLEPRLVYFVGLLFLVLGSLIGSYFVIVRGPVIAAILGVAVFSVYTYTNNLVYRGLAEIFVAAKGGLIVFGTYYVQTGSFEFIPLYNGIILGVLSACVLYVTSFPDFEADRIKGRKTLLIYLGKDRALKSFSILLLMPYALIIIGVISGLTVNYSVLCFVSAPYTVRALRAMNDAASNPQRILDSIISTVALARMAGIMLVISYLIASYPVMDLVNP
jgi:1,4-dihydroxy-2-naphthoate polyprenyltransferase